MKKLISLLISSVLIFSIGVPAFASETPSTKTVQSIIASVNQEYGVHFYIPDDKQSKKLTSEAGFNDISEEQIRSANLSPAELAQFEKELREAAEFLAKENAKTEAAWANVVTKADEERTSNDTTPNNIASSANGLRLVKSGEKSITGGTAYFEGWANNNNGFWAWEYMNTTSVTPDYDSNEYKFYLSKATPKYIDTGRTCAVSYTGTLHTKVGVFWVPGDSTQYVEWWAGM